MRSCSKHQVEVASNTTAAQRAALSQGKTGMRTNLPPGLCSSLAGTENKKAKLLVQDLAKDLFWRWTTRPRVHLLSSTYCHAAPSRSLIGCPLGPGTHLQGAGRRAGPRGCCSNPNPSSSPSASQHPQGSAIALGHQPMAAPWQRFELLLLSTRAMESKLEVMNTSGGRRKIPLGFVRELRQRWVSPR